MLWVLGERGAEAEGDVIWGIKMKSSALGSLLDEQVEMTNRLKICTAGLRRGDGEILGAQLECKAAGSNETGRGGCRLERKEPLLPQDVWNG